mmetsp:Transcript_84247/g.214470  ORF Transcript_84247/g.214470 Transcript_84247/m.214470 type:complete len:578 (+) Transcript_84247:100-1833(+)
MDRDIRRPSWRRRSGGDGAPPAEGSRRVLTRQSTLHRSRSRSPRAGTPSSARKSRRRALPPLPVGAPTSQSAAAAAAEAVTVPPLVEASGHLLTRWADQGSSSALRMLALADQKCGERSCNSSSSSSSGGPRPPLPGCLYGTAIAPFLHFGAPQRDQIYALGGRFEEQVLSTVEMFDTWRGKWVSQPPMAAKRCGCAAAALPGGGLLVVGGYDERGIVDGLLHSCEVFDPVIQKWAPCEHPLRRPRWGHACATLGGLVYTVGGCSLREGAPAHEAFMETLSSCEVLDPSGATGSGWRPAPSLCVARSGARVVALGSNYLAVVGGCDDVFGRSEVLSSVELFDISTQRWELLAPLLQVPRSTAAVAAIDDGRIMVVGGTPALASTEVYRIAQRAGGGGGGGGSVEGAPVALLARSRHLELRAAGAGGLRGGDDGCEEGAEATLDDEATENAEPVMFAECSLTPVDAELWGLGHHAMSGLADTCKSCEVQGLKCGADQVPIPVGKCLCLWRVDAADPSLQPMECDKCTEDCVGKFVSFDVGKFLEPAQTGGICIKAGANVPPEPPTHPLFRGPFSRAPP